jgi:hypothetical protein
MNNTTENKVTGWTGWVVFAAALLIIEGILNMFYGLGALLNAHWFVYTHGGSAYLLNVSGWGWWMLLVGMLLTVSGALLWTGNMFGRTVGVVLAILSALENAALITVAPVWSIIAIAVALLVLYAVAVHGGEMKQVMQN